MADNNQPSNASKEVTKAGAKAAANAYLGPAGGTAVEALSNTKLGDAVLTKGAQQLEKNPFAKTAANLAQKSGALDAANQAMDNGSGQAPKSSGSAPSSSMSLGDKEKGSNGFKLPGMGGSSNNQAEIDSDVEISTTEKMFNFVKKHWTKFLPAIGGFIIMIITFAGVIGVILGPADTVIQFFRNAWDSLKTLVGYKSTEELELEYYERLREVQATLKKKYNVCIDVNLITATLTVDIENDHYIDESKEEADSPEGAELSDLSAKDYKKMIKQIELLGNMQIRRTVYGLDAEVLKNNQSTGILHDYCAEEARSYNFGSDGRTDLARASDFILDYRNFFTTTTNWLYNWKNMADLAEKGTPIRDSNTYRQIASNDLTPGIWTFFTKKANEEKNIQYQFYVPAYTYEEKEVNGTKVTEKKCYPSVPTDAYDFATLNVGDLNDLDNVYYWNLMDSFIAEYYKKYLPSTSGPLEVGSEKYEKVKKIVEDIYLLWHEMGPSQMCEANSYICRDDEGADYYNGGEGSSSRKDFIEKVAPVAIDEMSRTGIFASITLAQAAIESRNGNSGLSTKYANYYGMTAGSCAPKQLPDGYAGTIYAPGEGGNNCSGNAFWNGSVVAMCNKSGGDCQWYRVYDSFKNSTMDHSRLLTEKYGCNSQTTVEGQLTCLIDNGYATASNYRSSILSTIKNNNLEQYDIGTWNGSIDPIEGQLYTDRTCNVAGGGYAGEWDSWKQDDSRWSDVPIGNKTVGEIGCATTAVAILAKRSGLPTTIDPNFNPGTFAKELAKVGGYYGNLLNWGAVSKIVPGYSYAGGEQKKVGPSEVAAFINQGYDVVLNVKYGNHFVAVDRVEGDAIYMFDSGSGGNEVGHTYGLGSIVGYRLFKKG